MTYVLILSVVASYGGVDVQREGRFSSYEDCAAFAVGWVDPQRALYPDDAKVQWHCKAR